MMHIVETPKTGRAELCMVELGEISALQLHGHVPEMVRASVP